MSDIEQTASGRTDRVRSAQAIVSEARRLRAEVLGRFLARLAGWVRERWTEPARRARGRRAELAMLMHLDDRTLDDIGVNRADLQAAAYQGVPLERVVAKRHEYGARIVPLEPTRSPVRPAHDLDQAA